MFIEYPKAVYLGGTASSEVETPYRVVNDKDEEAAAAAEGWFEIGKAPSEPEAPKKRGRPAKTEA